MSTLVAGTGGLAQALDQRINFRFRYLWRERKGFLEGAAFGPGRVFRTRCEGAESRMGRDLVVPSKVPDYLPAE